MTATLVLLLAGCAKDNASDNRSGNASDKGKRPCELFTRQLADELLGEPGTKDEYSTGCKYELANGDVVGLSTNPGKKGTGKQNFDAAKTMVTAAEPVTGIGDGAFWDASTRSLYVLKGDNYITAQVLTEAMREPAKARGGAEKIATSALSAL